MKFNDIHSHYFNAGKTKPKSNEPKVPKILSTGVTITSKPIDIQPDYSISIEKVPITFNPKPTKVTVEKSPIMKTDASGSTISTPYFNPMTSLTIDTFTPKSSTSKSMVCSTVQQFNV